MTLYLKYRPQTIDELDLESVREDLKNIIKSENLPHAFLFSGPKGTGKTSAARILAKIINCESAPPADQPMRLEPCNNCDSCISITKGNNIDIIELDAASNRGIDDIRSLKEGIYLAPAQAHKKVYIIDEAHMLTLEAANAFLKTLEEPPAHVVFILATTNPEKLPGTVISRLTQVNFIKATVKDIGRQLNRVAKGEKLKITQGAIEKISKLSDGSFRDAVKILENLSLKTKDIKENDILENSGDINSFFEILKENEVKKALEFIEDLVKNGISIKNFMESLFNEIHISILGKNGLGKDGLENFSIEDLIKLNELMMEAKKQISPILQLPIEIAVIKFFEFAPKDSSPKRKEDKEEILPVSSLDEVTWNKILQNIREKNVSIEALLRSAKPISFDGKNLNVGVYYQFHKDRLEDGKNMRLLEDICQKIVDVEIVKLSFELIEKPVREKKEEVETLTPQADKDIIDAAKEIFG